MSTAQWACRAGRWEKDGGGQSAGGSMVCMCYDLADGDDEEDQGGAAATPGEGNRLAAPP